MNNTPFIHLRTQSSYSLAESAIKIEKLVQLAVKHNMPAIALTDNNNMFGTLEFSLECQKNGIQPIIGTSINIFDMSSTIFLNVSPSSQMSSTIIIYFLPFLICQ